MSRGLLEASLMGQAGISRKARSQARIKDYNNFELLILNDELKTLIMKSKG